ncbi:MAG: hypothetical protein AAFR70_01690, partial [Pseudomonadota bacterium]
VALVGAKAVGGAVGDAVAGAVGRSWISGMRTSGGGGIMRAGPVKSSETLARSGSAAACVSTGAAASPVAIGGSGARGGVVSTAGAATGAGADCVTVVSAGAV